MQRPFPVMVELVDLKYDMWERGIPLEYFHASEDRQATRNNVFEIIKNYLSQFRVDSIIVEKRKTHPTLQNNSASFYKLIFDILLRFTLQAHSGKYGNIYITTDLIPLKKKRKDIEKGIKTTLAQWEREFGASYNIQHYSSKSDINLQVVDYVNWAIYRKCERNDFRSYNIIKDCIKSEFDVFRVGKTYYD
jgi:hypothetical protein